MFLILSNKYFIYYNCVIFVDREPKQFTFDNVFTFSNVKFNQPFPPKHLQAVRLEWTWWTFRHLSYIMRLAQPGWLGDIPSAEKGLCYINVNPYSSLKLLMGVVCEIGLSIWWHLANIRENIKDHCHAVIVFDMREEGWQKHCVQIV